MQAQPFHLCSIILNMKYVEPVSVVQSKEDIVVSWSPSKIIVDIWHI